MRINLDRNSTTPIYIQIREQIRNMILSGVLEPGFKLPPERRLAEILGVNRSTVLNAYHDLKADELIGSRVGQGTVVILPPADRRYGDAGAAAQIPWKQLLGGYASRMQQPHVSNILKNANRTDVISFSAGISTNSCDPIEELLETQNRLLKDFGSTMLQYSASEGFLPLRESLCSLMERRGISACAEDVAILSGSQQGIDLAARIFLDPGDAVIVEEPTFFAAIQIFQSAGARIIGVPTDRDGMRVDILESILERTKPKFIYTVPTFQNPSGAVMELKRRRRLLELAYKYGIPVIEDDPYGELRYDGSHLPTLKALDQHGYVIYLSSFSKVMFPGLRLGWVAADRQVIRQYVLAKQIADLHTNTLAQWIMNDFLRRGIFIKRLDAVIKENRESRDIMVEALKQYGVKGFEWQKPEGGLYFWCRLPEYTDPARLIAKAQEKKVVFVPGDIFYPGYDSSRHIRLSFSSPPKEKIKEGVKILMQAVKESTQIESSYEKTADPEIRPIL